MKRSYFLIVLALAAITYASTAHAADPVKLLLGDSAKAAKARDYRAQIAFLEQLASEYPDSREAPRALFDIAGIYKDRLKSPSESMYYYVLLISRYPSDKLSGKAIKINYALGRKGHRIQAPEGREMPQYNMPGPGRAAADGVASIKELLSNAQKAAKSRDYKAQIAFLEQIAAYYPENKQAPVALYNIAEIYRGRLNSPPDALAYYNRLISVYPENKLSIKSFALSAKLGASGHRSAPTAMTLTTTAPSERSVAQGGEAEPPSIEITAPALLDNRATSSKKQLALEGKVTDTSGIVEVKVNGREIRPGPGGRFSTDIYLVYGSNDITVTAMDRQGNISSRSFNIVRQAGSSKEIPAHDIDTGLPSTRTRNPDAIAVVIGNSDYSKAKDVAYAVNDAKLMKTYLVDVLGYKVGNIFYYENASKSDFEILFGNRENYKGKLFNAVKRDRSDIFIYYSGHGAPGLKDKRGYFVPAEADPQYIELSGYSTDVFYSNLAKVPARSTTIVLDACFSGASIFENISPMVLEVEKPSLELKNAVVLSSSTGSQVSSWYNDKEHGMFTYFFLKAIHNRNADSDKDGELSFEEIYSYISDNSDGVPYYARRIHGVEQNPTIEGQYRDRVLLRY